MRHPNKKNGTKQRNHSDLNVKKGVVSSMTSTEFKRHLVAAGFPLSVKGNRQEAASALGVSARTLDRYTKQGCNNQTVINLLLTFVYGISQSSAWQGWRITAQYLVTPDGDHIRQSDIRELWQNRKAKKFLESRLAQVEQLLGTYQERDKQNQVTNLSRYKEVAKLANEIENLVGHYDQLTRSWIG